MTATGTLGLVGLQLYSKKRVDISPRINFEYLLSLSATFGTQLWNTFIACPVLTRLLPRHQYGHVESYLKPKYLFVTTLFTGINAYRYLQRVPMPTWNANNNLLVRSRLKNNNKKKNLIEINSLFFCFLINRDI